MSERFLSPVNACYGGQQDIGGAGGAMMQSKRTSKSVDAAKKEERKKEGIMCTRARAPFLPPPGGPRTMGLTWRKSRLSFSVRGGAKKEAQCRPERNLFLWRCTTLICTPSSLPSPPRKALPEKQLPRVSPTFILPRRFLLLPLS